MGVADGDDLGLRVTGPTRQLLFLGPFLPPAVESGIRQMGFDLVAPCGDESDSWRDALSSADVIFCDWTGRRPLGEPEAARATRAALVQQVGVGLESIDLKAWAARQIPVANTAGANAVSVAEWCVASAFISLRSMAWAHQQMRAGEWPQGAIIERGCHELASRRVGIVGFGPVGAECSTRFRSLGSDVSYWTRRRRGPEEEFGATYASLDDLCAWSEILVVVIALTQETQHLLGQDRLRRMPAGSIIINAARGGVVDESALLDAIRSGHLAGAALDVFSAEPLDPKSPLRLDERILLSPHAAALTTEAVQRIVKSALANLGHARAGEPMDHVQNGVDAVARWRA
jgi:phosphoglycerate dehydrogenase-like enzyme